MPQQLPPIHHRQQYHSEPPRYTNPVQPYYTVQPGGGPSPQVQQIYPSLPPLAVPGPVAVEGRSLSIPAKRSAPSSASDAQGPPEKKGKWTPQEDKLAIELRRTGMKWDDIAKRLPGRSAISCRLRYQNYSEKRQDWDEEKKNKLARLYNRFKQQMWETIAKEMGLPWRAIEGIHWEMGREEMAQRANVPVFQPHTAALPTPARLRSPPRPSLNLAPAPLGLNDHFQDLPAAVPISRVTRARSTSTSSRTRGASSRRDGAPTLATLSEGEQPRYLKANNTSPNHGPGIPHTPASSDDWNGSPPGRPTADEHLPPLGGHPRRRSSSSQRSSDAALYKHPSSRALPNQAPAAPS